MISAMLSMNGPVMSEEETEGFSSLAQWVLLHERGGRLLVDCVGDPEALETIRLALLDAGRDPTVICAWHQDGSPVEEYPLDLAAWLAVAPDELDFTDPENPVASRPTEFRVIHTWAGWAR